MSETAASREKLAPYCVGFGIDVGFGGSKVVPTAWAMDLPQPQTAVGSDRQQLQGTARDLSFVCDGALDYIYSSHVLEDFTYGDLADILTEWRRVLRPGGLFIVNCPDQQRFLAHCAKTGQPTNGNHKEQDFSLETFSAVFHAVGEWRSVMITPEFGPYSWLGVWAKA
jgi:predicted SAM-dependent methyltransferase